MGRSRYAGMPALDGNHYGTWKDPVSKDMFSQDILNDIDTIEHVLCAGERLDGLASRYYGDDEYWWVIAIANRILDPFSLTVGRKLRIPRDAKTILDKVRR